jgi:hypothetical protein
MRESSRLSLQSTKPHLWSMPNQANLSGSLTPPIKSSQQSSETHTVAASTSLHLVGAQSLCRYRRSLVPTAVRSAMLSGGTVGHHWTTLHGTPQQDSNGPYLVVSSLASFASYYLRAGEVARPKQMEKAFALAAKLVKRGGRRTAVRETGSPGPIAMADARRAYASGCWLRVGDWHHQPRGDA